MKKHFIILTIIILLLFLTGCSPKITEQNNTEQTQNSSVKIKLDYTSANGVPLNKYRISIYDLNFEVIAEQPIKDKDQEFIFYLPPGTYYADVPNLGPGGDRTEFTIQENQTTKITLKLRALV